MNSASPGIDVAAPPFGVDASVFDFDAYARRIGLTGRSDIRRLHTAHVASIPFENLDPHAGLPVSLELKDLQRKLVGERRGGYCFEQNLLLKAALEALGAEVQPMLARVRRGAPPGAVRPRSHLVLRVEAQGACWLADAGFGTGTLLEPLPFGVGEEHRQAGWRFRLVQDGNEHVLQTVEPCGWMDLYGFVPEPVPFVDLQTSNWFTCSHPSSPFVTGLIVGAQSENGLRTLLSDWEQLALVERTPASERIVPIAREQIPHLLATRFGLRGFALDGSGRVRRADS